MEMTPAPLIRTGDVAVSAPPPELVTQVGHVRFPLVALSTIGLDALMAKVPLEPLLGTTIAPPPTPPEGVIPTHPVPEKQSEISPVLLLLANPS